MKSLEQSSIQIIKANQAASGAYIASPAFSQYGYSWLRDGMWIAHSMDAVGEHASAAAFHRWVERTILRYEQHINALLGKLDRKEPISDVDLLPTRFTLDGDLGSDVWTDFQLDGYGAWLWGVVQHCRTVDAALWDEMRPAVRLVVRYLDALWMMPNYDCWEEFRDEIHISTLAALYGGLAAVQSFEAALVPDGLIEKIRSYTLENGVSPNGHFIKFLGNANVDASLLWVALPFGLVDIHDPRFLRTVEKIEQDILRLGGGVYRYCADNYFGGGEWLLLTCWLAWVYLRLNRLDEARRLMRWVEEQARPNGEMPEQVSAHTLDPAQYQPWVERWGNPACPLLWSHAMYLIVQTELDTFEK
ncbi:MAG: glycoside hydrolase family 15 protein [Anaerolineaceae bacterium]|nr:glycoside hydrolase family 15 protein [Anaerolineaceae bacterium]